MRKISSLFLLACVICLCMSLPAWSDSYYDQLHQDRWQQYVGVTVPGLSITYNNACLAFLQVAVMPNVFGKYLSTRTQDQRVFASGGSQNRIIHQHFNENDGNADAGKLKEIFSKAQVGDVVLMVWWNTYHAFIIRQVKNDGIEVLEANNPLGKIQNNTWSYKYLANAYAGGPVYIKDINRNNNKGFTIYRYIDDISSGENPTPPPSQQTITITTDSSLPNTTKSTYFNVQLECTGSGSTRWQIISGNRPDGIDIDQFSGLLRGTSEKAGTFTFTVQAQNDSGIGTKTFTLTVNDPDRLVITTDSILPSDTRGAGYDFHFSTNKGSARWELIGGSLPPGIKLDEGSGHLYSTFEQAGTFTFRLRASNDYGTDEKEFTITVKEPPITYTTTRWEIVNKELVIDYKASSGNTSTAKFPLQASDDDNRYVITGLPANITVNLPANWTADTDKRAVTVSDASKTAPLADENGIRISGAASVTVNYDGVTLTARQIQNVTRWEVSDSELLVECGGTTYRFQQYNDNGDRYFIVSGLPNGSVINLPEDWTADTDRRAVTVSDESKIALLADEYGVRISGACTIMVNYSGITFIARQTPSDSAETYAVTRWEVVGGELVVEYKGSSGTENTAKFPPQTLNGDNMYIVFGLPANITINLTENWAVDTDGRAVTVSDASKVSALADSDAVRIVGACAVTVNHDGITFTARRVQIVTRWEIVGDELILEYSGNTYRFQQQDINGDVCFIITDLPKGTVISLPSDWAADTDGRAVTVSDFAKVSSLMDEYAVRITGKCTITVNYEGITFTARRVQTVTRWAVVGDELMLEYSGNTYRFQQQNINGDVCFIVEGLPNGAVINLPEDWFVDTDGRAVTVSNYSQISPLADEFGVRISGSCFITVNYAGIAFTARQIQRVTSWEMSNSELVLEISGNTYKFPQKTENGDTRFVLTGLPNGVVINLPDGWIVDTDRRAVTINDGYKVSPLSDEYGIRVTGPCTITVNYSGITLTARKQTADSQELPKFRTHSLLLSGQIGVNFYMDLPEISGADYTNSYVDFSIAGDSSNPPQYFDSEFMNRKKTYYGFRCYIKSVQMADTINAVFHYGDDNTVTHEYSAEKYLNDSLAADIPSEERALIEAIKDFGHYAQLYLSRVNGWELGTAHKAIDCENEYSDSDIEAARQAVDSNAIVKDIPADSGIKRVGFSLNLDADTTINLYIYPEDGCTGSIAAYIPGSNINDAIYYSDRNRYKLEISNIPAHRLAETFTVRVVGKKEFDVKVSAFSYAYAALNDSNASSDEINTVVSLYRYYVTNIAYREYIGM